MLPPPKLCGEGSTAAVGYKMVPTPVFRGLLYLNLPRWLGAKAGAAADATVAVSVSGTDEYLAHQNLYFLSRRAAELSK